MREIVTDLVSQGVGATVAKNVREVVTAVTELAHEPGCEDVSLTKLMKKLGLDKSSTSRRASDAIARGYLKNLEEKKGRPARLVVGDPLPDAVEVLPAVEKLGECCGLAPLREGVEPSPSPVADNTEEKEAEWTL